MDDLAVLIAPAVLGQGAVFCGNLVQRLAHPVEQRAIAAVADGMDIHLDPVTQGLGHHARRLVGFRDPQAGRVGPVGIGLQQRRTARAQRAIHIEFHGPGDDPAIIGRARHLASRQIGIAVRIDRDIDADRQAVCVRQVLDHRHIRPGHGHVVRARPA